MSNAADLRRAQALDIIDRYTASFVSNRTNASTNEIHVSTVGSLVKDGLAEVFLGSDGTFVRRALQDDAGRRRASAEAAVAAYLAAGGGDPDDWESTLSDLLTDLRHVAIQKDPDLFDRCVSRSQRDFDAERNQS